MESRKREMAALLALLRRRPGGVSWNEIAADVAAAGSAMALLHTPTDDALFASPELDTEFERALSDVESWIAAGHRIVTVLDADFPSRLLNIRETPPFLFYEGALHEADDGMSVIGSRSASGWGLRFAAEAAEYLVSQGLTVIAGLAAGIDTAAHRAALDADGRTVAFLGTGVMRSYPAANTELQSEIADIAAYCCRSSTLMRRRPSSRSRCATPRCPDTGSRRSSSKRASALARASKLASRASMDVR